MEIMSRSQAIAEGKNTYFTGKACRNGHLTYRYVYSGTCFGCIKNDRPAKIINANYAFKKEAMSLKFFLHMGDAKAFEDFAHAVAALRFPGIDRGMTYLDKGREVEPCAHYRLKAAQSDRAVLEATAQFLRAQRGLRPAPVAAPVAPAAQDDNEYLPGSGPLKPFN